jgi:YfiH family protein
MLFSKIGKQWIGQFDVICDDNRIIHAFSTRIGGVSTPPFDTLNLGLNTDDNPDHIRTNRSRFLKGLQLKDIQLALPRQIHGNRTAIVTVAREYADTDALITDKPGIGLTIQVADCLPIFLYDSNRLCIGLVHAGWRGTVNQIALHAVHAMISEYRSNPADIRAFIGPSIGPLCYEVGNEVIPKFKRKYVHDGHVNLWQCNQDQLIQAGIPVQQIQISGICTHCHSELFYSHRADGVRTGRMMAVMMIKDQDSRIKKQETRKR